MYTNAVEHWPNPRATDKFPFRSESQVNVGAVTYVLKVHKYSRDAVNKFNKTSVAGDGAADDDHPLGGRGWNGSSCGQIR